MERPRQLAPSFIGSGTLATPRDMLRALESLETVDLLWEVEGRNVAEGQFTLVKLMFDPDSATMAVNAAPVAPATRPAIPASANASVGACTFEEALSEILLADFKLEFGRLRGALLVGGELSPDGCRFWDRTTREDLGKGRSRRSAAREAAAYQEIYQRICT